MNTLRGSGQGRQSKNTITTKSGKSIKINRSLSDRIKSKKMARQAEKAAYLSTLPKNRFKRILYRLHPKRVIHYWFSREGGIMALKLVGILIIVCFFTTVGLFSYYRKDLPAIKDIAGDNLGGSVSYYDSTGKVLLWEDYNAVKRVPVQSNQISPYMKEATVAIEDKNFYHEGAFDVRGIMRAAVHDAVGGGGALQGGSTITQQLVKLNENWTNDRTITRKVKELILAVEVERKYTKDDILTGYLNIAPYGGIDYGVQSAAEDYFQTTAADLTLPEASMLAAIPQAPSYYSPYGSTQFNPAAGNTFSASALLARQHYILQQMVTQGYITQAQATAAEAVNVLALVHPQQSKYQNIQDPYFVLAAKQQLEDQFGTTLVDRGGLKVITTLNLALQQDANNDVAKNAANVAAVHGDEEAMVAESVKTGQVVALVGGENFNNPVDGQINYANTNISPGSSFKPFLYAALIQNNTDVGAGSVLYDNQQPLPGYPCTDKTQPTTTSAGGNCLWDDNFVYPGPETIRYALAGSRNVPAVKASYEVDPTDTSTDYTKSVNEWISMANAAIGTKNAYACYQQGVNVAEATAAQQAQCYGSAALGSGDSAIDNEVNGDVTFARLGQEIPQTYILNVTDATNNTLYQWQQPKSTQVYNPDTAYIINSILDDPRATYLQPYQKFQNYDGWDIAVKTGTENQEYNGVMTAWSTQYAVIGFAGYHTLDQPLEEGHFEDITEPITRTWMEQALDALHTKPVNWTEPSNIKTIAGYVQRVSTGYGAEVPGPTDDLYPAWYTGKNSGAKSETIDKVSGYLETSCTPALARETIDDGDDSSYSIDIFYPRVVQNEQALEGRSPSAASLTQTDDVHNCDDSPPTVSLTAPSTCNISCTVTVTASQGTKPLSGGSYTAAPAGTIDVTAGGHSISDVSIPTSSSNVYTYSFTYTPSSSGSVTLTATAVDSVLYSGTNSQTITTAAAQPISLTITPGSVSPGQSVIASWSGGTGTYTVAISGGNSCTATTNSCKIIVTNPDGTYGVTVTDSNGDTGTSSVTVSGP